MVTEKEKGPEAGAERKEENPGQSRPDWGFP